MRFLLYEKFTVVFHSKLRLRMLVELSEISTPELSTCPRLVVMLLKPVKLCSGWLMIMSVVRIL